MNSNIKTFLEIDEKKYILFSWANNENENFKLIRNQIFLEGISD